MKIKYTGFFTLRNLEINSKMLLVMSWSPDIIWSLFTAILPDCFMFMLNVVLDGQKSIILVFSCMYYVDVWNGFSSNLICQEKFYIWDKQTVVDRRDGGGQRAHARRIQVKIFLNMVTVMYF